MTICLNFLSLLLIKKWKPSASNHNLLKSSQISSKELDYLKEQLTSLKSTVNALESEMKIRSVDVTRPEASFKFVLPGVSKFFEVADSKHVSDRFQCRGLHWSLSVKSNLNGGFKTLGFYLRCENDDPGSWSCKVAVKLLLYSHLPNKPNLPYNYSHTFDRNSGCGFSKFVSYGELIDESNGYLKDDRITLGVELKVGSVVRG